MMTPTGAFGVRDALFDGAAELNLPLSPSLLSVFRCEDLAPCGQGRCPICASKVTMLLHSMKQAPELGSQRWQKSAFALRSFSYASTKLAVAPMDKISAGIAAVLDGYVRSFLQQDNRGSMKYGCIAQIGLVEDCSPARAGEKVVVVEFALTGGNEETDYDMFENLHAYFGKELYQAVGNNFGPLEVEPIPLLSAEGCGVLPEQGLLFGYTKRRLDKPERPRVITSKKRLARMAVNYGDHTLRSRIISRGLSNNGMLVFDQGARGDIWKIDPFSQFDLLT